MDSAIAASFENIIPFEPEYAEHHRTVKIPRESIRRKMLAQAVRLAETFESDILFNAGTFHINGKSPLMAFTLLNALKGQLVEVIARGRDSTKAVEELSAVFERRNDLVGRQEFDKGVRHETA